MAKPLNIGEVAGRAGMGVETIRFYEREGLIEEPPRTESGYRQYPPEVVKRLLFIRKAKELGFSLKEIGELLNIRRQPGVKCAEVNEMARGKLADIDEKMRLLQRIRDILSGLLDECDAERDIGECPILGAIGGGDSAELENGGKTDGREVN